MRVGTCTLDETTSCVMNSSSVGRPPSSHRTARGGGVLGGVGGMWARVLEEFEVALAAGGGIIVGSHWMTSQAAFARYEIMLRDTGV